MARKKNKGNKNRKKTKGYEASKRSNIKKKNSNSIKSGCLIFFLGTSLPLLFAIIGEIGYPDAYVFCFLSALIIPVYLLILHDKSGGGGRGGGSGGDGGGGCGGCGGGGCGGCGGGS